MPNSKLRKNRFIGGTVILFLLAGFLFAYYAWSGQKQTEDDGIDEKHPVRLKVAYEHAEGFMSQYGRAFTLRYPHISFEVVTAAPGENLLSILEPDGVRRMLDEEQVDLVWMNARSYEQAALEGRLAGLDGWLARDGLELEDIDPNILAALRQRSGGHLYAFALESERMALYYNPELFETYGVPFPTDRMSWEALLQLAARFPNTDEKGQPLYGLSVSAPSSPGALIDLMGRTNRLQMLDPVRQTFTLHSASWQRIWELVLDRFRRGTVLWEDGQQGRQQLFMQKQVAMTIQSSSLMNRLLQPGTNLSWDVVAEPVNLEFPDESSTFDIPRLAGIREQSPNQREAWEFLKMLYSSSMLRKQAWVSDLRLWPQKQLLLERVKAAGSQANVGAFYALQPGAPAVDPLDTVTGEFNRMVVQMMNETADQVLKGTMPLEEALQALQRNVSAAYASRKSSYIQGASE